LRLTLRQGESLNELLGEIPNDGAVSISIMAGLYEEKVAIDRDDVELIGLGCVTFSFSDHHGAIRDGKILSTGDSASFSIRGKNFHAKNITFKNSFNYLERHSFNESSTAGALGTQAVALMVGKDASDAIFESCRFDGCQDTLYVDGSISRFFGCGISGCVDFIFGSGEAIFEECKIHVKGTGERIIAAPSTTERGFTFKSCVFSSDEPRYCLARPWHISGDESRNPEAIFRDPIFLDSPAKELFAPMSSRKPDGTERIWKPEESRFSVIFSSKDE